MNMLGANAAGNKTAGKVSGPGMTAASNAVLSLGSLYSLPKLLLYWFEAANAKALHTIVRAVNPEFTATPTSCPGFLKLY